MTNVNTGLSLNDITDELEGMQLEDQTVASSGGFDIIKIPRGKHPVRLVEYVEFGMHPQKPWQGAERDDADEVMLTFEFLGKRTVTPATDDKPATAMRKSVYMKKSIHEKAAYRKLFEKMRGGNTSITNMSQMVGHGSWLMTVQWTQNNEVLSTQQKVEDAETAHKADKDNKDLRIWDNIRNSEGYMITQAVSEAFDEETGETVVTPIKVPAVMGALRVFLWDNFKPKFWNSLFIEGTYTKNVDGKEVEVSKNRLQQKIMDATNYEGSPVSNFVDGLDTLGDVVTDVVADVVEDKPKKKAEPKVEAEPAEEDLMNDLGL